MMTIEEYIIKRKKQDGINEFDMEKQAVNLKLIVDYAFEYFYGYLDRSEMEKMQEEKSNKAEKYRNSLSFYSDKVKNWLVHLYIEQNVRVSQIVSKRVDDLGFPLYTEESEYNKLSYMLFASMNKKYPFILEHMEMLKMFLKEYHDFINYGQAYDDTYKLAGSEKIDTWVENTKKRYHINLQAFAEYYCESFSNSPQLWDRTTYYHPETKEFPDYDIAKSKDILALNTFYPKMSNKPFIKEKKRELRVLLLMYYKERIDDVPAEIISKSLESIGVKEE
jgi:hypothetical protein